MRWQEKKSKNLYNTPICVVVVREVRHAKIVYLGQRVHAENNVAFAVTVYNIL